MTPPSGRPARRAPAGANEASFRDAPDVLPLQIVGATPGAFRRIGVVPGGVFEGERLSGTVLEGGADSQDVRRDNRLTLNVRLALKTVTRRSSA